MNERLVFILSVLVAEIGASASLYTLMPESPLVRHYPGLLAYLAAHAVPALGAWALLSVLTAVVTPKMWRRRQNRSTKLSLLARIGLLGLAIDLAASVALWVRALDEGLPEAGSPVVSYSVRLGMYAGIFTLVVVVADQVTAWHDRRNPPAATPPPRFGRV